MYEFGGGRILVDCGEPVCRGYKANGASFDALDGILISHYHFDHFGGFFMLVQGCWLEGRRRALPVHLPRSGITTVKDMLEAGCLFPEVLVFELGLVPIRAERAIQLGPIRVTPHGTSHLAQFQRLYAKKYPGNFEAYSFVMEADGRRVAHSGDIGGVDDLDVLVAAPLDLLVCELAHVEVEALFEKLRGKKVKNLVLTHLSRALWAKKEALLRRARKALPGIKVQLARDEIVLRFE